MPDESGRSWKCADSARVDRVYVTRGGRELDEAAVRTKVKVGVPVRVHYVGEGDSMMVDRVILDED